MKLFLPFASFKKPLLKSFLTDLLSTSRQSLLFDLRLEKAILAHLS
jgi:hypothetical protein